MKMIIGRLAVDMNEDTLIGSINIQAELHKMPKGTFILSEITDYNSYYRTARILTQQEALDWCIAHKIEFDTICAKFNEIIEVA